jgi:cobalamin biosynthetic protein CobC
MDSARDHGGDLGRAITRFGGTPAGWIDLSTGINRLPWPVPDLPPEAWRALPTAAATAAAIAAARAAWDVRGGVLPLAGAQAAIQLLPRLAPPGRVGILAPTYNEFAPAFDSEGWRVEEAAAPDRLAGCAAAVVVNPNNPDGRCLDPAALIALAGAVGLLIVDESFADPHPEVSLAGMGLPDNLLVLRSFGKFHGLAGVRLGFVLGARPHLSTLARLAGPWPVSGPALALGTAALADADWRAETIARLARDATRLDAMAAATGWRCLGGTALFRLYDTADAAAAQARLARTCIWSRVFPYSPGWLRLGLPGPEPEWARLEAALG